jgi:hypothetical protein
VCHATRLPCELGPFRTTRLAIEDALCFHKAREIAMIEVGGPNLAQQIIDQAIQALWPRSKDLL